ncbi:MAG: hypothetical protein IPO27_05730 [Bacteroidetes bacterium]|nr:hypothetical protein [Bacteroidota bacterium]
MNTNWSGGKDAGAIYSTNCACIVNIPDANFKSALVSDFSINTNEDGEIQCAEAIAYTGTINVNSLGISDLTGIEAFTNLTGLDCSTNNLTALDISYNTFLQTINCAVNSITNLAFTGNSNVQQLIIGNNLIPGSINLTGCTNMFNLNCANNLFTSLTLVSSINLSMLQCQGNALTSLDVSNNTGL